MFSEIRSETLAAQAFNEAPTLRAAARKSLGLVELKGRSKKVKTDSGSYYVVEGDLLLDEDELQYHALQKEVQTQAQMMGLTGFSHRTREDGLVGAASGGRLVRWRPGMTLKYCVLRNTFPSKKQYDLVKSNMKKATDDWTEICGIEFAHDEQYDQHEDSSTSPNEIAPGMVFSIRYFDAHGQFIAAAFFPTYPPVRRRVLIDPSYFSRTLRFNKVGVLRHELGHVLGFRHEHIRSGAPAACPDESTTDTIDLTAYDPQSVMHYYCGGVGSPDLALTELDRLGAEKVYGPSFASMVIVE